MSFCVSYKSRFAENGIIDFLRLLRRRQQNSSLLFQVVPFLLEGAIVSGRVCTGNVGAVEELSTYRNEEEEEKKREVSSYMQVNSAGVGEIARKKLGLQQACAVIGCFSATVM